MYEVVHPNREKSLFLRSSVKKLLKIWVILFQVKVLSLADKLNIKSIRDKEIFIDAEPSLDLAMTEGASVAIS